jgi:hypothetical protein
VTSSIHIRICASARPSQGESDQRTLWLTTENGIAKCVMEEGVLHIELLNWLIMGDSNSEHRADGGQFHNSVESLIVLDPGALSEPLEDPASLVPIKGPIGTKLVREDPLAGDNVGATGLGDKLLSPIAHQGPILASIAACQLGSTSVPQIEVGIEDDVSEEVMAARTRRSGST